MTLVTLVTVEWSRSMSRGVTTDHCHVSHNVSLCHATDICHMKGAPHHQHLIILLINNHLWHVCSCPCLTFSFFHQNSIMCITTNASFHRWNPTFLTSLSNKSNVHRTQMTYDRATLCLCLLSDVTRRDGAWPVTPGTWHGTGYQRQHQPAHHW